MTHRLRFASLALLAPIAACGGADEGAGPTSAGAEQTPAAEQADGHAHAEDSLGAITIGDMRVELSQGHGAVAAGKECHLVVKLPYSDQGATTVRAWIGTFDKTASYVGKGEYASDHDDYDVHATAPDPLPADAMWWVELEKPDGVRVAGSAKPKL